MDRDTYRVAGYSEAELQQMIDRLDDQYGTFGALTQQGFQDFADGVNGQRCHNATGEALPPGI
jgi:hypothetical protein